MSPGLELPPPNCPRGAEGLGQPAPGQGQRGDSSGTAWGQLGDGSGTGHGGSGTRRPSLAQRGAVSPLASSRSGCFQDLKNIHVRSAEGKRAEKTGALWGWQEPGSPGVPKSPACRWGGLVSAPIGAGEPAGSCLGAGGGMGRISAQPGSLHTCLPWDQAGLGASGLL